MRVLFMGTPEFARVVLENLARSHEVVGLVCQGDKPFGRKQELKQPATKEWVKKELPALPILQPDRLDSEACEAIAALNPEIIIVVAYGKILPKALLERYKCLNVHASILPKYRGASPLQEMLLHGDRYWGVSVMEMEEGLDSGAVLGLGVMESNAKDGLAELSENMANLGAELLGDVLARLEGGAEKSQGSCVLEPLRQDDFQASYCQKIKKDAGRVTLASAREVVAKYRAYGVWPSVFLESGVKLFGIELESGEGVHRAGEILRIDEGGVVLGCERGSIKVEALQAPSKQKISAKAFVQGRRLGVGDVLE